MQHVLCRFVKFKGYVECTLKYLADQGPGSCTTAQGHRRSFGMKPIDSWHCVGKRTPRCCWLAMN